MSKSLIDLHCVVGLDGVPLHFQLFPKLWLDLCSATSAAVSRHTLSHTLDTTIALLTDSHGFLEYVDAVLLDERASLNNQHVFQFLQNFFPKVSVQVLTDQVKSLIHSLCKNLESVAPNYDLTRPSAVKHLNGDLKALLIVHSGVEEIKTQQLRDAVIVLKERTAKQLEVLGEPPSLNKSSSSTGEGSESDQGTGSSETPRKISIESGKRGSCDSKRKSCDEKSDSGPSTSKRSTGNDRLRDSCNALMRSLNLLLECLQNGCDQNNKITQETGENSAPSPAVKEEEPSSSSATVKKPDPENEKRHENEEGS